jgi:release factor glutamine methyltransferase
MLAEHLRRERLGPEISVLDLCTGSGLLALVAAARGASSTAIDVSRRALASVRLNAAVNRVRVTALRGDLFEPVAGRRFDLIVSNPPYLPDPEEALPARGPARAWDAGPSGRAFLDRICAGVGEHLNPGGALLLIHSSVCGERQTLEALSARGLEARTAWPPAGRPRQVAAFPGAAAARRPGGSADRAGSFPGAGRGMRRRRQGLLN